MASEFTIIEAAERAVIGRRAVVTQAAMKTTFPATFQAEYGFIGAAGLRPAGPPFVVYHGRDGDLWDVAICAPYLGDPSRSGPLPEGLEIMRVPGATVLRAVHHGPYETIGSAYSEMTAWADDRGYVFNGPPRECYMSPPDTPASDIDTVIEWPVAPAAVAVPV